MDPESPIDLTVDPREVLPKHVVDEWLPNEHKSIFFLFQGFNQYPPHPSHYILPTNFQEVLHQAPVEGFDYKSLITVSPPANQSISKAYQHAIKESKFPILSVTLQPQYSNPIILPTWIFDYWVEIEHVVDIRRQWKTALTWVQRLSTSPPAIDTCKNLLLGLSSLSWSHGAAYSKDITSLLSSSSAESFLRSLHIDHMVQQIKDQYQTQLGPNQISHHVFMTVDQISAIIHSYGPKRAKKEGYVWETLRMIENKIVLGNVNSLCGIIHHPLHWVSVVIDFQQMRVLFGDSLGDKMPRNEHLAFEQWIKYLVKRSTNLSAGDTTFGQLPTGQQMDGNSCGLFALNSIAHHYVNEPLLPTDPITLNCRRVEIALNILSTMTVSVFQIR